MARAAVAIMVADEDAGVSAQVCDALADAGYATHEAATGEDALETVDRVQPALAILDVRLPGRCGYEVCHILKHEYGTRLPILFISSLRRSSDRVAGLLIGADDYLTKPFAVDELVARVRALLRRSNGDGPAPAASALTQREQEVLSLLAEGLDQSDIARRLLLSPKTVGTHIEHVLQKLDVRSRAQAVAVAYRDGLVGNGHGPASDGHGATRRLRRSP